MKYKEALQKRGLSVNSLSKALQKKIKDLDAQVTMYAELNANDDLSDADLEDAKVIKSVIDELDKYITHKVNIFDQAKYDAKLANVNKAITAREKLKKGKDVEKQEVEVQAPRVVDPIAPKVQPQPNQVEVQAQIEVQEPQVSDNFQIGYDGAYEHEEEFENVGEGKPKRTSTGLILMGLGAFFLTWGAVNFFRSKR